MNELRVWAPNAKRVEAVLGEQRLKMHVQPGGWWQVEIPSGEMDYAFSLDGGPPFPDPRSPWQPYGVHRPSRTIDHASFGWSDQSWRPPLLSAGVVYELHVGTFTSEGTFTAAIERLDKLVDLGVTHLSLMPVADFPGQRGWGYDGVSLFAPHQAYGGPQGLKKLVDACHARGLAVMLDVVYNHLGPDGNYLGTFGPYFSQHHSTSWGSAVNLDGPGSDEVRRFFIDNALMWLRDYHFDGLRLDAVHALIDASAVHFLEQLAGEVRLLEARLGRSLVLVAESDLNDPRLLYSPQAGGFGLDAQWSDDFHHALHAVLTGEKGGYYADFGSVQSLAKALARAYVYEGQYSSFRRRHHGRAHSGLPAWRFFGYLQNHDQVGNRAGGERSSQLLSPGLVKVGAALVLLGPFTPMLFQGEEWGASTPFQYFTDHQDPALGEAVSQGRKEEFASFGWQPALVPGPQDPQTFLRSKLDWSEREREPHSSILEWHRSLTRLRREQPDLRVGWQDIELRYDEQARWLLVRRGRLLLAVNFSGVQVRIPLIGEQARTVLLASDAGAAASQNALHLPAESTALFE